MNIIDDNIDELMIAMTLMILMNFTSQHFDLNELLGWVFGQLLHHRLNDVLQSINQLLLKVIRSKFLSVLPT